MVYCVKMKGIFYLLEKEHVAKHFAKYADAVIEDKRISLASAINVFLRKKDVLHSNEQMALISSEAGSYWFPQANFFNPELEITEEGFVRKDLKFKF